MNVYDLTLGLGCTSEIECLSSMLETQGFYIQNCKNKNKNQETALLSSYSYTREQNMYLIFFI